MTWYYKEGDLEKGPVNKKELQELINAKRINGKTLVRGATMKQWIPLAEMVHRKSQNKKSQPPPTPEPLPDRANTEYSIGPADATMAVELCSQCGRSFPLDQVVTYDNKVICAACKPMFVQKLKEGAAIPGAFHYAGFWIRLGAKIIDGLIMVIVQWVILVPMGMLNFPSASSASGGGGFNTGSIFFLGVQQLIGIVIPAIYNTFFIGRFGATPGKMACRIKVVTPEGGKVSYLRALGRNFAEWISAVVLGIGYLMAAFDSEKRALHDRVCSTRVIRK